MKKHTASLMTAAMLLTLAWMTGCDSGKTAESSKAATTTALENKQNFMEYLKNLG